MTVVAKTLKLPVAKSASRMTALLIGPSTWSSDLILIAVPVTPSGFTEPSTLTRIPSFSPASVEAESSTSKVVLPVSNSTPLTNTLPNPVTVPDEIPVPPMPAVVSVPPPPKEVKIAVRNIRFKCLALNV